MEAKIKYVDKARRYCLTYFTKSKSKKSAAAELHDQHQEWFETYEDAYRRSKEV